MWISGNRKESAMNVCWSHSFNFRAFQVVPKYQQGLVGKVWLWWVLQHAAISGIPLSVFIWFIFSQITGVRVLVGCESVIVIFLYLIIIIRAKECTQWTAIDFNQSLGLISWRAGRIIADQYFLWYRVCESVNRVVLKAKENGCRKLNSQNLMDFQ